MSLDWRLANIGLCATRGDTRSAQAAQRRTADALVHLALLLNRRYRPGTVKWLSREFYRLPQLASEIGPRAEGALACADLQQSAEAMDGVARHLAEAHNQLGVTAPVAVTLQEYRGQMRFSPAGLIAALRDSLPPALRELEVQGACDQWLTNEDVLLWAKHLRKFRSVYRQKAKERRDGVGDMMI